MLQTGTVGQASIVGQANILVQWDRQPSREAGIVEQTYREKERRCSHRGTGRHSGTVKHSQTDRQGGGGKRRTDRQTGKMKEEHRTDRQMQALWGRQANRDRHSGTGRQAEAYTVEQSSTGRQTNKQRQEKGSRGKEAGARRQGKGVSGKLPTIEIEWSKWSFQWLQFNKP